MSKLGSPRKLKLALATALGLALAGAAAQAEPKYGPGVTDTEIKIGQTMSYSGPAASYGRFGKVITAYFTMINEQGGINGRKINMISLDDGFSAPKTVEMTRQLVESDNVAFICCSMGTAPNAAVQKYLNEKKIPQLFVASGATRFTDGAAWPWTTGFTPTYKDEGREAAKFVLKTKPDAKIALLYQNNDAGQDMMAGFKEELGPDRAKSMIVADLSYEQTDATVSSQLRQAKAAGADVFFEQATSKFTAQMIRIASEIGWKPLHIITNNASSIAEAIEPAGFDNAQGVVGGKFIKEPGDPLWADDAAMKEFHAWIAKYYPEGSKDDQYNLLAYVVAQAMVDVIKAAGDDLTRENLLKQALSLNIESPYLLQGIKIETSDTKRSAISQMRQYKIEGKQWVAIE